MTWREEHGDSFAVPEAISSAEGWEDTSWHNDAAPSFELFVDLAEGISRRYVVWSGHPDPELRECPGPRFMITVVAMDRVHDRELDEATIFLHTDDADTVVAVMRSLATQPGVRR